MRLLNNTPSGQGSARQQTPQPLQLLPSAGLGGASGWIAMTRFGGLMGCGSCPRASRNGAGRRALCAASARLRKLVDVGGRLACCSEFEQVGRDVQQLREIRHGWRSRQ